MQVTALLPIKKDSERLPGKNLRVFAQKPLYHIIYESLAKCLFVDEILVNTDCEEVKDFFQSREKVNLIDRPDNLLGSHIVANDLIAYDIEYAKNEHIFQTHCTNPLLRTETMDDAIELYFRNLGQNDSLFAAEALRCNLYDDKLKPVNHISGRLGRTQDMLPLYRENSCFFIFSKNSFLTAGNSRIGKRPAVYAMNRLESIDIDYEEDFLLAELIYLNRHMFRISQNPQT